MRDTISGTLSCGLNYEISRQVLNNMELVDALAEMRDGDALMMSKITQMLLGTEQRKALYDCLRLEDGRVPTKGVETALMEIFEAFGDSGKN